MVLYGRCDKRNTVACDDFVCNLELENRLLCLTFLLMLLYIVERTGNKWPEIRLCNSHIRDSTAS